MLMKTMIRGSFLSLTTMTSKMAVIRLLTTGGSHLLNLMSKSTKGLKRCLTQLTMRSMMEVTSREIEDEHCNEEAAEVVVVAEVVVAITTTAEAITTMVAAVVAVAAEAAVVAMASSAVMPTRTSLLRTSSTFFGRQLRPTEP